MHFTNNQPIRAPVETWLVVWIWISFMFCYRNLCFFKLSFMKSLIEKWKQSSVRVDQYKYTQVHPGNKQEKMNVAQKYFS